MLTKKIVTQKYFKKCSSCGEELPFSFFHKKSSNPDGLEDVCIDCQQAEYFLHGKKRQVFIKKPHK